MCHIIAQCSVTGGVTVTGVPLCPNSGSRWAERPLLLDCLHARCSARFLGHLSPPHHHQRAPRWSLAPKPPHSTCHALLACTMEGSSYRLQTPRPRQPPSPLNFDINNSFKPSSVLSIRDDSQTLLYDLPASMSPPTSPKSPRRVVSPGPSSPSYSGRPRGTRNGRPTPPPSSRNRSATPLGLPPNELEQFAEHCRAW